MSPVLLGGFQRTSLHGGGLQGSEQVAVSSGRGALRSSVEPVADARQLSLGGRESPVMPRTRTCVLEALRAGGVRRPRGCELLARVIALVLELWGIAVFGLVPEGVDHWTEGNQCGRDGRLFGSERCGQGRADRPECLLR